MCLLRQSRSFRMDDPRLGGFLVLPLLLSGLLLLPLGEEGDYPRHSGLSCERLERFEGDREGGILGRVQGGEIVISPEEDSGLSSFIYTHALGFSSRVDGRDVMYLFPSPSCGSPVVIN